MRECFKPVFVFAIYSCRCRTFVAIESIHQCEERDEMAEVSYQTVFDMIAVAEERTADRVEMVDGLRLQRKVTDVKPVRKSSRNQLLNLFAIRRTLPKGV